MKIDGGAPADLAQMPERARALEEAGYDGLLTAETAHDPFLPLALAAEHTERIEIGTSIAVAFARTPMLLANVGHDLNAFSKGRFVLGLGSQIKPHITKRFSMPWSHPAARMRELISAMRAIWDNWYTGAPLDFKGEFYTHTLMTPFFTPTNTEHGPPKVFLAAVGPLMSEVAGEVCDGIICHSFTTEKYVREVTIPAIERGLAKAGKSRDDFEIKCPVFVVSGDNEEEMADSRQKIKQQIGFYGSTPA
ncbi:MAG: TIGR03617 family F420-dependent LLM class oxidoreductase, partial [Thermoanaerobaculia bacterium]|nr:TIGR03617 family F420-dependent LLM class oxidoreductase [Thermoanaerobaculia bacterium]